jgi:hypothetical protein
MRLFGLVLSAVTAVAGTVSAQNEAVLKGYFEGRTVTPKIAMPGTEDGVDIHPGTGRPLAFERYADRLKDFGTAIRAGEPVMVTKIRVKSKHIEFQLAAGGYGTLGDETSTSVSVPAAPQTKRERNLEGELKRETDPAKKRAIKEEIDDLRKEREREDARNRAAVAEAGEHRKANLRQLRLEGGSRFNVRYDDRVPASALTPAGLKAALAEYVDFGDRSGVAAGAGGPAGAGSGGAGGRAPPDGLPRQGMLLGEADALFGPARATSERTEGRLKVVTRTYRRAHGTVTAEFVEGVLFRFNLSSE